MKTNLMASFCAGRQICNFLSLLLVLYGWNTSAGQSGDFTYEAISPTNTTVIITQYTGSGGNVAIPEYINGLPVVVLGSNAFSGCVTLTNITTGNVLVVLSEGAFLGCSNLTGVTLGNHLSYISDLAFSGCAKLTNILLPSSVNYLEKDPFFGCASLTNFSVDSQCPTLSGQDGVLFNKDGAQILRFPPGRVGSYVIPQNVNFLGDYAFADCAGMTAFYFSSNPPTLGGTNVFAGATNATVYYAAGASGWQSYYGTRPASKWVDITNFTWGKTDPYSIQITSYTGTAAIVTVPLSINGLMVTSIGAHAFDSCTGMASITLSPGISSIDAHAFVGCTALTQIYFEGGVPALVSGSVLANASQITVYYLAGTPGWGASFGGSLAIAWNGKPVYEYQKIGSEIEITKYNGNGGYLVVPSMIEGLPVTSLGNSAFINCGGLTNITLPSQLSNIGNYTFQNCASLTNIFLPQSVTNIGYSAFYGCGLLADIAVDSNNLLFSSRDGVLMYKEGNMLLLYPGGKGNYTVPENVTQVADYAFNGNLQLREIMLPSGLNSLGKFAFAGCSNLSNITLPDSIVNIDFGTFSRCTSLTNITFSANVTNIGRLAFSDCISLSSLSFPDSLTNIGEEAFSGCNGLANIVWGRGITDIGPYAFNYCGGLTSVSLPARVASIGDYAFSDCDKLTNISVSADNPNYRDLAGVLFNKDQTTLIQYPSGKQGGYQVPEGTRIIWYPGFSFAGGLTSINVPSSVTNIVFDAFYGCEALTNITVDPASQSYSSIGGVLFDKPQKTLVCYPSGRTGDYNVPNSVTYIGAEAFADCAGLTGLTLPEGIAGMGFEAFARCSRLTSITLPNSLTNISMHAFAHCDALTNITVGTGVTYIDNWAFSDLTNLTAIYFLGNAPTRVMGYYQNPTATVYYIPGTTGWTSSFYGFPTFPWDKNPLYSYVELSSADLQITKYNGSGGNVVVPDTINGRTVASIGDFAFLYNAGLTSVTLPATVTSIGRQVFAYCPALTNIAVAAANPNYCDEQGVLFDKAKTTLLQYPCARNGAYNVPASVTEIEITAFAGCAGLTGVTFPEGLRTFRLNTFAQCTGLTSVILPNSLTSLGNGTFYNCTGLTNVTFGNGLSDISQWAFWGCSGLTSLNIPEGVRYIDGSAFNQCSGLRSVTLPNSVNSMEYAFNTCTGLTNISVGALNPKYCDRDGVLFDKQQTTLFQYPGSRVGPYEVPASVTSLYYNAFYRCAGLTSVTVPNTVTNISDGAFGGCASLTNITVSSSNPAYCDIDGVLFNKDQTSILQYPGGRQGNYAIPDGVTQIIYSAFYNIAGLTAIALPESMTNIGSYSFFSCPKLTNIIVDSHNPNYSDKDGILFDKNQTTIINYPGGKIGAYEAPDHVTTIGKDAFSDCAFLTSIILANGVTNIGREAFYNCVGLTNVFLPNSITSIGDAAFGNCTSLTSISLPDSVTSLPGLIFQSCTQLAKVFVGKNVTLVGADAFYNCSSLTGIYFTGYAPTNVDPSAMYQTTNVTVYYLAGTTGWGMTFAGRPTALWTPTYNQWLITSGLAQKFPAASGEQDDADHDGMTNIQEMLAGTDPTDAKSSVIFESHARPADLSDMDKAVLAEGKFALYFRTVPGKSYDIQSSDKCLGTWSTIATVTATTTQKRVAIDKPANMGFYRAVLRQ